jgi:hypothetical protein
MIQTPVGRGRRLLARGIVNGLIGAAVVAAWFFILDLAGGRPFHTPAALGSALFFGAQSEAEMRTSVGVIAGYTAVHIALFAAAGVLLVAIADYLERVPSRVLLVVLFIIVLEAVVLATAALAAAWVLGSLGLWTIVAANLLAAIAMGWHVWRTHPDLRVQLPRSAVDV